MPTPGAGARPSLRATAAGCGVGAGVPGGAFCTARAERAGTGFAGGVFITGRFEGGMLNCCGSGEGVGIGTTAAGEGVGLAIDREVGRRGRAGVRGGALGIAVGCTDAILTVAGLSTGG